MMIRIVLTVCIFLISSEASAQSWREIVPLRSNCADLKQKFGINNCVNTTYDFADAKVAITFSDGTCATGWKVESGTVLLVEVSPKKHLKFEDLHLDRSRYQKTIDSHLPDVTYYRNEGEGVSIAVFSSGRVVSLTFGPSIKDKSLECPNKSASVRPPRASIKFDEYEALGPNEEEGRLNNFVTELMASSNYRGYVIAYGRQDKPREAQEHAARVKAYLVSRGVTSDRITVADGGYRDHWTVELFIVLRN